MRAAGDLSPLLLCGGAACMVVPVVAHTGDVPTDETVLYRAACPPGHRRLLARRPLFRAAVALFFLPCLHCGAPPPPDVHATRRRLVDDAEKYHYAADSESEDEGDVDDSGDDDDDDDDE